MTDVDLGRPGRPAGFDVYPAGYGRVFDRAVDVFYADPRVRGMWLHGAFGRGAADRASDLDITLAVRDSDFDVFAGNWPEWLAEITPTVNAEALEPGCLYAMTPDWERLDVISEPVSRLPTTPGPAGNDLRSGQPDGDDSRTGGPTT